MTPLGTVAALRRFPVKSMLGQSLERCAVTARGLDGDRAYALVDAETGKVATAKRPHLWRGLLAFEVTHGDDGGVCIVCPDSSRVAADDPDVGARLSEAVGRKVTLAAVRAPGTAVERARPDEVIEKGFDSADVGADPLEIAQAAPDGGFFDYAPVSVLTTSSLARIAAAVPDATIALERYRPNIVVATPALAPFAENDWRGRRMWIGDALVLDLDLPTPRCAIPMLAYGDQPAATGAVAAVNRLNRVAIPEIGPGLMPCLGAFARVAAAGEVRLGDAVRLEA